MGIEDRLNEDFAPGWIPEVGDIIDGIVEGVSHRDGEFGPYPIITVRRIHTTNGSEQLSADRVAIHCMDTGRKLWMEERTVGRGDRVAFKYNGRKPMKNKDGTPKLDKKSGEQKTYHDFAKIHDPHDRVPAHLSIDGARATNDDRLALPVPPPSKGEPF